MLPVVRASSTTAWPDLDAIHNEHSPNGVDINVELLGELRQSRARFVALHDGLMIHRVNSDNTPSDLLSVEMSHHRGKMDFEPLSQEANRRPAPVVGDQLVDFVA